MTRYRRAFSIGVKVALVVLALVIVLDVAFGKWVALAGDSALVVVGAGLLYVLRERREEHAGD